MGARDSWRGEEVPGLGTHPSRHLQGALTRCPLYSNPDEPEESLSPRSLPCLWSVVFLRRAEQPHLLVPALTSFPDSITHPGKPGSSCQIHALARLLERKKKKLETLVVGSGGGKLIKDS